jgi:hypothetical protein
MPQESPITFSPGQKQTDSGNLGSTFPTAADAPVYDFRSAPPLGANQFLSASGTSVSSSSNPNLLDTSAYVEQPAPEIPSGAALLPPLKVADPGRAPKLITRQLWEGTVTELSEKEFVAILSDKTDARNPDEQAVFDLSEISPEDHKLIRPGASFYWTIGNEITVAGQLKNVSMVQFRRLPPWTQHRLERGAESARRLRESFQE